MIDDYCHRHFYTEVATRYFDVGDNIYRVYVDDLLSVTSLGADDDDDGTWEEAWTEGTHYTLGPDNVWPKFLILQPDYLSSTISLYERDKYIKITGVFGYGTGLSNSPWRASGVTLTVASTTGTSVTASATGIEAGQTLRAGTEDMYISAVSGTTLTAERGVNGSTAAIHAAVAATIAEYPKRIETACLYLASQEFNEMSRAGFDSKWIGSFGWRVTGASAQAAQMTRMLAGYHRENVK